MNALKQDTALVSDSIQISTKMLEEQNIVMQETITKVTDMMHLLNNCLTSIENVHRGNTLQKNLVVTSYEYNNKMQGQIEMQDHRFSEISNVIQSNTEEIMELTAQADQLNQIVNQLNQLLD